MVKAQVYATCKDTNSIVRILATLPCASAFRPCFMIKLVKMSITGSTLGGNARGSYPLTGFSCDELEAAGRRKLAYEGPDDTDWGRVEGVEKIFWRALKPEAEVVGEVVGCSCRYEEA